MTPVARVGRDKADVAASMGDRLYGVTLDNVERLDELVPALEGLPKKATTRIVFQEGLAPRDYAKAVPAIHRGIAGGPHT